MHLKAYLGYRRVCKALHRPSAVLKNYLTLPRKNARAWIQSSIVRSCTANHFCLYIHLYAVCCRFIIPTECVASGFTARPWRYREQRNSRGITGNPCLLEWPRHQHSRCNPRSPCYCTLSRSTTPKLGNGADAAGHTAGV